MNTQEAFNLVLLAIDPRSTPNFIYEAIEVLRKSVEWQPMESAPKDKTVIAKYLGADGIYHCSLLLKLDNRKFYDFVKHEEIARERVVGWREVE